MNPVARLARRLLPVEPLPTLADIAGPAPDDPDSDSPEYTAWVGRMRSAAQRPLALLNTSIVTTPGTYRVTDLAGPWGPDDGHPMRSRPEDLTPAELARHRARVIVEDYALAASDEAVTVVSYIGHQSTADAMADLIGQPVAVSRAQFSQQVGQQALVLKLRGRLREGETLDRETLEAGYDLMLMTRVA